MDSSTQNVTLLTGFVFDVLSEYQGMRSLCQPAFALAAGLDPDKPGDWCPITIYNEICDWIEKSFGLASIKNAGRAIGDRAFKQIVKEGKIANPHPAGMMEALKWAASTMIKDPNGRGWEIRDARETSLVMRRTQTFNCMLQEGLLVSLVERTGAVMPTVEHVRCTRRGDEFCDYRVSWLKKR